MKKLSDIQLRLVFERSPKLKALVEKAMPDGYDAYLIFKPKPDGIKPFVSFRSRSVGR